MHPQLKEIIQASWGDKILTDEMKNFVSRVEEYFVNKEVYYNYYEAIISASDDLVFEVDSNGTLINAFVADEKMLLIPREKLIGKSFDELLEAPLKEKFYGSLAEVISTNKVLSIEYKSPYLENYFLAKFSLLKKTTEVNPHVLIQIQDITEKKKTERKVFNSEERFRNLIETARDIFFITDKYGNYTYVNEVAFDKIGYTPEELIGINFIEIVRPDYRRRVSMFYYKQIQDKAPFSYLEFQIDGKNGEKLWIGQNVQLQYREGEFVGTQSVVRDITNYKNSEHALMVSEDRFRKLLKNSMDVITVLDESGNIIYDNFSIYTQFGYEQPLIGTSIFDYFHPEDLERAKGEFEKVILKKGVSDPIEFRFKAADGSWKYVEALGNNLLDEPAIKGIVINSRDITERKKIEKALMRSEERFRKLVQYSSDITTVVSLDGNISYVSPSFFRLFGFNEELVGRNIFEFIHPEDLQRTMAESQKGIEKGGVSDPIEFRFKMPNGEWKYLETIGNNLINEPSIKGIVLNSREISERKKVETKLVDSNMRLSAIIESTNNAIFAINKEYCYIAFNKAHQKIIKDIYHVNIEIGDSALINSSVANRDREPLKKIFDRSFLGEQFSYIYETEIEGQKTVFYISANPIKDANGNIIGSAIFSEDITKEKKIEEDLILSTKEAIEASKAKSEFLSNMSHEIRTPMNAIVTLSDLLLEKDFDDETNKYLTTINGSINNLLAVLNDILDFSKIEEGKVQIEKIDFDLHEKVYEVESVFKQKAESKNIKFSVNIAEDVPKMLNGDPYRLNQILINLIGNAIKFTLKGAVKVTVNKTYSNELFDKISFNIQDTGIGIPSDKIDSIFDSFTQASIDVSRNFGGTGLGLAITKKLIQLQNGTISVKSVLNVGTLFTFELTFGKSVSPVLVKTKPQNSLDKNLAGLRILVVEDNKINQFVVKQIISKWNANIEIVSNGREAIDMLMENDFDIVLMDLQMPELTGFDATKMIRSENSKVKNSAIPIIALTADAFIETKREVLQAGMDDFVTKPINQEDLFAKIVKYTSKKI
jgi:PAS domain S-box-containing protein